MHKIIFFSILHTIPNIEVEITEFLNVIMKI